MEFLPIYRGNNVFVGLTAVLGFIGGAYLLQCGTKHLLGKIADKKKARNDADDEQICIVCCAEINASDPKSYATCCMCNKRICRNNIKCGNWLPSNAQWECQLCHSSKESMAQTSSWVAEQMSFNRQKLVYPMRARSEIYIPINDCNDSSMHFESVSQIGTNLAGISAEEKIKIREYVEELVANMLGGSLDQIQVGQMSKSENYLQLFDKYHSKLSNLLINMENTLCAQALKGDLPAILNNGHSANTINNNNNNNNNNSNSNKNNNNNGSLNNDEPALIDISQTRLRQLIETIIAETLRSGVNTMTASSGAVSEITLDTRSNGDLSMLSNGGIKRRHRTEHYFEPKIYQDLLATAVLNKISDKEGNTRLFSESTPDLSARNIDENYNVEALSTTSGSSIEPRSDCSLTDHELVLNSDKIDSHTSLEAALDRESVLNDYIAAHMVPLPDISASVTESEDDIASMTSSMVGEGTWEDNWLFKKKRSGLPSSTTSSSMLVPAPTENVRAQIGDKTADEVSDLSEMGSDTDDSSLDLMRCNELNDRLLNKHLIGGHNTKLALDELVDRSSMTSATLPVESEIPIADTKNSLVIYSVMKTEAINGNLPNANEGKAEDLDLPSPLPPMNFQDESIGNEIQNPKADPIESDESIESIQSEGCVGYSFLEYIEDANANENMPLESIRAHMPSVIEILAAIALGPMLAVPASEQEGVMSHNELNTLKELSDLALAEINARTTDLHHSLDVIEEESSEKDLSLSIVDAQCDLLSQDNLPSHSDILMEIEETTVKSFDHIPPPPPPIVSIELQPDFSSIYLEGIPPPNEVEELKSLEYMTFEAPFDFTSSPAEEFTIAPIMEVLSEQPAVTENVIVICTPENHCCDPDEANTPSAVEPVAVVDAVNNPTIANDDDESDNITIIAETIDTFTAVMAESVPMVEGTAELSIASSTPTTTELAAVSTAPTNISCEVPTKGAVTEAIAHSPEIATIPVISESMETQNEISTETSPTENNATEASTETATDTPPTVSHKVEDNEVGCVATEATIEVAATDVSEGTVAVSEITTKFEPPKASQSQYEDVILAEENPPEAISEPAPAIEEPKPILNEVTAEPVITEATIATSEIPGESEIVIVSENTLTTSEDGTEPIPILEAATETSAATEISKEASTEQTENVSEPIDTSNEIAVVSVDTVIPQPKEPLSEVSAETVILETTNTPSEGNTVNTEVPVNPCEITAEPTLTVEAASETPASIETSTKVPPEENAEPTDTSTDIVTVSIESEATVKCSSSEIPANDSPEPVAVIDQPTAAPNKSEVEPDVPATIIMPVPKVDAISELPEASDALAEVCSEPTALPSEIATKPIPILEASSEAPVKTEPASLVEVVLNPLEIADIPKEVSCDPPTVVNVSSNIASDLVDAEATADAVITEETVAGSEVTHESVPIVVTASKSPETDTPANNSAEPAGRDNEVALQLPAALDTPAELSSETDTIDAKSNDINVTEEPAVARVPSNEVTAESVPTMEATSEPPEISDATAELCCKPETLDAEIFEMANEIISEPIIVSEHTGTPSEITAESNTMEEVIFETPASMEILTEVLTESAGKTGVPNETSSNIAIPSVDTEAIVKCSAAELSAKDNPTEVLTETEAEVDEPIKTTSESEVPEATVTPNDIVVEPNPLVEVASDTAKSTDAPVDTEPTQIVEIVTKEIPKEVSSDPVFVVAEATDVPSANTAPDSVETVTTFDPAVTEATVADSEAVIESIPIVPSKSDLIAKDSSELAAMDTEATEAPIEVAAESIPTLEGAPQSSATSEAPVKLSSGTEVLDAEAMDIKSEVTAEPVVPQPKVTPNEIASEPIQSKEDASDAPKPSSLATAEVSSEPPTIIAEDIDVSNNTAPNLKDTKAGAELVVSEPTVVSSEIALESVPLVEAASKLQDTNAEVIDAVSEPVIVSEETVPIVKSVIPEAMETTTEVSTKPAKESTAPDLADKDNTIEPTVIGKPTATPSVEAVPQTLDIVTEICSEPVADTEIASEYTVTLSEVAAEPNRSVEVSSDISPSNEPTEKVTESTDTSEIAAVPVSTEVIVKCCPLPEPETVVAPPTATLNEDAAETVTTITPSEDRGESISKVEASSELPQTSELAELVTTSVDIEVIQMSPKDKPADAISEPTASIENPIASPSVEAETVILETQIESSDVAAEPVSKNEVASELPQTLDIVADICCEPEADHAEVIDSSNEIETEPVIVSENTTTTSEVTGEPNAIVEATSETPVSLEAATEVSTESGEKVDAPTDTSMEKPVIETLNEVPAAPVTLETIKPSEVNGETVPKVESASELSLISKTVAEISTEPETVATAGIETTVTPNISTTTSLLSAMELVPPKCTDIVEELVTEAETVVTQSTQSPSDIEVKQIHAEAIVTPSEVSSNLGLSSVSEIPEPAAKVIETIVTNEVAAVPILLIETVTEPPPEETNTSTEVATETLAIVEPSSELLKTVDTLIEATTETTAVNAEATDTPIDVVNDSLVAEGTVPPSAVAKPTDVIDTPNEITTESSSEPASVDAKVTDTSDELDVELISVSEHSVADIAPDKISDPEAVVTQETETPSEVPTSEITSEIVSEMIIESEQQGTDGTLTDPVSIDPEAKVSKTTDLPSDNATESRVEEATVTLVKTITEPEVLITEDTISAVIVERVPTVDAAKATNALEEVPSDASAIPAETIDTPEPLPTTKVTSESLASEEAGKEVLIETMTDIPTKDSAASVHLEPTITQSEPKEGEILTDIPSEIVVETGIAVESDCKSPAVTENIDTPVQLVTAPETATSIPEATDPCAGCSDNTPPSIGNKINIDNDDAGLGKMTQKCLRRQPHVLDTTPSDDDSLAKPVNLFATICKFYIKDKRLLATIEGRRRKTLVMYRYLSSFDEADEIEYDFHPSQNNNDHHQNTALVVESITNERESLLEIPKNEYEKNESPHEIAQNATLINDNVLVLDEAMPEFISDFSLEQSVFILDNLSEISFSFINAILFSDQISSDSSQSGESTATTTFETFDGDNEDESDQTPTINNRTNIVPDINNILKPTNTNSCTYTTNGILTNGSLRRSKKAKACAATLNGEHVDDEIKDDDVALMRRFVPGSIAERECKKWYNAVDMPNNPYAPEALKQRISGHLERCMDVPNISPSTESNPLALMTDNNGEVNAEQSREPDYTRYSRDYYINEAQQTSAKCQSPTESRQSLSLDQSESIISANNVINEAQNVNKTTNESMQPSQPTQEQESSIRDSSCIFKALPAQVVVDEGSNNPSSLETLSNQSMQSIQTTTSDDSETVRVYNFEKQETTILRGDFLEKKAKISETTDTTSSSMESAMSSPMKETTPAKKRERPKALQFSGAAANTGSDSSSALGSPKTPTRGSTPPAFKFLQPKRKLIEPSQVLSMDLDDETIGTPSPEKVVIEHEVVHAMPSVKALAQAFLLTSKTSHAVRRWPTKAKKSTPETPTKLTTPTAARKNLLESCVSVAEVADEATIASDLSSLETDPSMNLDSEPKESLAAINETLEEAAGKVSPVPVRAGFLRSNIAFFENLKFK